ncbi:transient receptor potential cation channel subfamily A member 1-like [Physella acuta]|uniref:transient receptor potential cation channel subfamily A member 1-like n=1 Tax=Physella acuta TaxID=109671 RepID=UPI0027DDBE42|nr:transient receptor potential cation channel subfamily A member 1-like [Physella acuta]
MVPLLLRHHGNHDKRNQEGRTPLHVAVENRATHVVKALLNGETDINCQDHSRQTPLILACKKGFLDLVKLLVDQGAEVNKKNISGQTCLHVAAQKAHLDVLEFLLQQCPDDLLAQIDAFDQTALHLAAKQRDPRFVEALLKRGCSPEAREVNGLIPLHVAASVSSYETVLKLADVTENVDVLNFQNKSAFFLACEAGNRPAISALRGKGANAKIRDKHFRNTLMVAAIGGYTDIVEDLIRMKVELNCRDNEKNTALHHACYHGHLATVKSLLDHKASVTMTNLHDKSPLDVAVDRRMTDVAVFMMEHSSWEKSLSVRDKKGYNCMDRMIEFTPEAVKIVLDKCVKYSDNCPTDEQYSVEFNYRYIDPGPNDPMSKSRTYNAIATMLCHEREDLLGHPLCQSNLSYKWRQYGCVIFGADFTIQMAMVFMMLIYCYFMPKPNRTDYACREVPAKNETNATVLMHRPTFRYGYMYSIQIAIYCFVVALVFKRTMHALAVGWHYAFSSQLLMTMVSVCLLMYGNIPPGYEPCDAQWRAVAYSVLVFLLMVSFILERFDRIGLYFTMFFEVFKTMLKVSFLMIFYLLALAVPLGVMLNTDAFQTNEKSLLATLAMTVGELNFQDNFILVDNSPFTTDLFLLFPLFCLLMNLTLMNLMIGVAVGDISKVEKKAYLNRLKKQVDYLLEVEASYPMRYFKYNKQKLIVYPNEKPKSTWQKLTRPFLRSEQIYFIRKKHQPDRVGELSRRVGALINKVEAELGAQRVRMDALVKAVGVKTDLNQSIHTTPETTRHQ